MRIRIIIFTCMLSIFALIGCLNAKNKSAVTVQNESNITSLKIHNSRAEFKEVKSQSDITQVVNMISSVRIIQADAEIKEGIGYGVEITYSDGKKESFSFSNSIMFHDEKYYEVDKNVGDDLKSIYDKY